MDFKIGQYYKISMNKKLGSGAFGEIYHGNKCKFYIRSKHKDE
jgi:hypothetical protein